MTDSLKALVSNPSHEPVTDVETHDTPETETVEASAEAQEEAPSELDVISKELETYKKRLKDTQSFAQKAHQENLTRLNNDKEAGVITDEEFSEKLAAIKSNDIAMAENPLDDVAKQFDSEKELVIGVMGLEEDKAEAAIQAFNRTMALDPALQEKLMNVPATQRTKWVLEQGLAMGDSVKLIDEHGGILGAINHLKANKPDMEALKAELRKELSEELNNKSKPNLSNLGGSTAPTSTTPTGAAYLKSLIK